MKKFCFVTNQLQRLHNGKCIILNFSDRWVLPNFFWISCGVNSSYGQDTNSHVEKIFVKHFSYIKTLRQNLFLKISFQIFILNFWKISFKFLQLGSSVSKKAIFLSLNRVRVSSGAISFCYNTMIRFGLNTRNDRFHHVSPLT